MNSPLPYMDATNSPVNCGLVSDAYSNDTSNYSASIKNTVDIYDEEFAAQIEDYEAWQAAIWLD